MPQTQTNHCDTPAANALLQWYDRHARQLPWRVPPAQGQIGVKPDPYRIWLSEIMLQQTTVVAVKAYFLKFTANWPDVHALAHAADETVMAAWAGLGYYARARNLLATARVVSTEYDGVFPDTEKELQKLPGIGPYTAAAIAAIAYGKRATVVDGNVERVMARIFDIHQPLPDAKPIFTEKAALLTPETRCGDYAQALMDLGATICTPKNPACGLCPWRGQCTAWHQGTHLELPKKRAKQRKPTRQGVVYVARRVDGAFLLEERPRSGLLGGMIAFPSTGWDGALSEEQPIRAEWRALSEEVRHSFTHFHLRLNVKTALVPMDRAPQRGTFVASDAFDPQALPSLMRKVYALLTGS